MATTHRALLRSNRCARCAAPRISFFPPTRQFLLFSPDRSPSRSFIPPALPTTTATRQTHHHYPRFFSTTPPTLKKSSKANRTQNSPHPPNTNSNSNSSSSITTGPSTTNPAAGPTPVDEAFDFSGLESSILKALEKLTHDLSQLRSGGRFNTELLEALRVHLVRGSKESVPLSDVAQVVPRGRNVSVVAGEVEHLKPISSALSSSPYSLNPQPADASAPTTLTLVLPPPTAESRQAALASANKTAEEAQSRIRMARQAHQKKLRALELGRKIRSDDSHKAHKMMEEVVRKGNEEVRRILEGAKKVLER